MIKYTSLYMQYIYFHLESPMAALQIQALYL
jgi:hypothetical protein